MMQKGVKKRCSGIRLRLSSVVTAAGKKDSGEKADTPTTAESTEVLGRLDFGVTLTCTPGPQRGKMTFSFLWSSITPSSMSRKSSSTRRGAVTVMTFSDGDQRFSWMKRWQEKQARFPDELNSSSSTLGAMCCM